VVPQFSANIERSGNIVYIYHDGGDPLQSSRTLIRINGQVIPSSSLSFLHSQNWPWTPGKTLRVQYDGPGTPDLVEVVYSGSKGQSVIFSSRLQSETQPTIPITIVETISSVTAATPSETVSIVTNPPGGFVGAEPPQAGFDAEPKTGQVPLVVRFRDTSSGSPTSWLWNFGDGETSTEQNPVHEYKNPGAFTVALTVRNQYGTGQKVEKDFIKAGTVPEAQFAVVPSEGEAPLTVQFTDLSKGLPTTFSWDFGDGTTSTEQNPLHTYDREGEYTVSLTVGNQFGSNTRIQSGAVKVATARKFEVSLTGSRKGTLSTGYILFTVTGQPAWIKIGGTRYDLATQDTVQVFIDKSDNGLIDVNANGLTDLKFDAARLYVNGNLVRSGIVNGINIPSYSGLSTSLSIEIAPGDSTMNLFVNEGRVLSGPDRKILISNLCENSNGLMNLKVIPGELTYRGGARGFSVMKVS